MWPAAWAEPRLGYGEGVLEALELHLLLTGLDRDSIEMREVSPMRGRLSQDDRADALAKAV